jgi:hypothetical protein
VATRCIERGVNHIDACCGPEVMSNACGEARGRANTIGKKPRMENARRASVVVIAGALAMAGSVLAAPADAKTITCLIDKKWEYKTVLYGANGITALTFCGVPVAIAKESVQ